jgi:ComF family protein
MAVGEAIRGIGRAALDAAFPGECSGCGREGAVLCPACLPDLDARLERPAGTPIGLPSETPAPLLQLEWCAPFSGTVRRALHELKYAGERRLATPLGVAVARRWRQAGAGGDVLVHVPVHAERARRRGYDQAALIAAAAAAELRLSWQPALERRRSTTAQFELGRGERAANVHGAFVARDEDVVAGSWVVLVDDVVTTGSTLVACATALLDAGAVAVSAVTVARER